MGVRVALPAATPCGSCPYRRDVPSGVWHDSEYDKLPEYDREMWEQPAGLFMCHQQSGRLCAGWVGTHDMAQSMAFRLGCISGSISDVDADAILDYATSVPLFGSGAEAARHGKREVKRPSKRAVAVVKRIAKKRTEFRKRIGA